MKAALYNDLKGNFVYSFNVFFLFIFGFFSWIFVTLSGDLLLTFMLGNYYFRLIFQDERISRDITAKFLPIKKSEFFIGRIGATFLYFLLLLIVSSLSRAIVNGSDIIILNSFGKVSRFILNLLHHTSIFSIIMIVISIDYFFRLTRSRRFMKVYTVISLIILGTSASYFNFRNIDSDFSYTGMADNYIPFILFGIFLVIFFLLTFILYRKN